MSDEKCSQYTHCTRRGPHGENHLFDHELPGGSRYVDPMTGESPYSLAWASYERREIHNDWRKASEVDVCGHDCCWCAPPARYVDPMTGESPYSLAWASYERREIHNDWRKASEVDVCGHDCCWCAPPEKYEEWRGRWKAMFGEDAPERSVRWP